MANSKIIIASVLISFFFLAAVLPYESNAKSLKSCGFDAIYQLGDSISDTGNFIQEKPSAVYARFPYGETFFNRPTGRCSNGRLMIDFIASSAGVPFLDAYLNPNGTFTRGHGVNFAVASSTALPADFLSKKRIFPPTYSSLSVQLDWMFSHFNSICFNERDCVEKLKNSLFMVGEIGVNDYTYAFFHGKTMEEVKNMVPDVVKAIKDAVKRVIGYGARRVVVPGNAPIGCFPIYLAGFQTNNTDAYDKLHCLKGFNNLSAYHNDHLKQAIEELKRESPNAVIAYADYYNAFQWILTNAPHLGFDAKSTQKACCGAGGDYGYNALKMCGTHPGVPVCPKPDRYISWDGVDLTQKANQYMAMWIIDDILPKLRCPA
uniref:Acetylajmalan esterase-like n=1 Tax=Salix viminalis TaxID=40686 RepID=A0A6N2KV61_SALVM